MAILIFAIVTAVAILFYAATELRKARAMGNEPRKSDLLVPFEQVNIPEEYKKYYQIRRGNLFASIQRFHEMWKYYIDLDRIWMREFDDMKSSPDGNQIFPLMLYFNAHAKVRISIELGFSGCMAESRSILRDAVEFVAHAHSMLNDPALQLVWLNKNDEEEAFKDAFERNKRTGLFNGLEELHSTWKSLSEFGAHANLNAICDRFATEESEGQLHVQLKYTGLDEAVWAKSLFTLLLTCFTMENTLYHDYETRLQLDDTLLRMRAEFQMFKEQLRGVLIKRYKVERPVSVSQGNQP